MPEAPNTTFDLGWKEGAQQSHLQQVLASTRATQQQSAQLKAQQEQTMFDPESLNGPDVAPDEFARRKLDIGGFASGATKGPNGRDQLIFKTAKDRDAALEHYKLKSGERQAVAGDKSLATTFRQAAMQDKKMLDANGKLLPQAERHLLVLEGSNPNDPNREGARKTIKEWNDYKATVAKGGLMIDARGQTLGDNIQTRQGIAPPKARDDDHKIVQKWDTEGNSTYAEEAKKGSDYWNEAIALAESGVPQNDPRITKLIAKANYGRAPFVSEGQAPFNKAEWDLSKIKPAGVAGATPPPGVASATGQVSGDSATQTGAQSAAWLRESAKNPALSPEDRQTLLKAAVAAEKVQAAGVTQSTVAAAPRASEPARPPGVGPIINKKPGDAKQINDAKEYDDTLANIETVRKYIDDPELKALRGDDGVMAQSKLRGKTFLQDNLGVQMGIGKNVEATRAALIAADAAYRRSTSGVNVTVNESAFLKNLLATEPSDPAFETKLAIFEGMVERARRGLDATLDSSHRQAIPRVGRVANPHEPPSTRVAKTGEKIPITRNGVPGSVLPKDFNPNTDKFR